MTSFAVSSFNLNPSITDFVLLNSESHSDGTNWYIYCNNNPLNRQDPTGLFTFQLGIGVTLGGGGVTGEIGIGFSISKDKGIDLGVYAKGGVGSYMGGVATLDLSATVSAADEIIDMRGSTITSGGSGNATVFGLPGSIGGEASIPLAEGEQANSSLTDTVSLGPGTAGEGHVIYTDTKLVSVKDTLSKTINSVIDFSKNVASKVDNFVQDHSTKEQETQEQAVK